MIGPEEQSGFTDSYIRDSLWDNNFDIEETMAMLAGMSRSRLPSTSPDPASSEEVQERKNAARERRGELQFLVLVPLG
jgi:hypothetical protein